MRLSTEPDLPPASLAAVQRFFFHTRDGETVRDGQGVELADLEEARMEAVGLIAQMLRDHPREFWATENLSLTVTDAAGLTQFTILVSGVTTPAPDPPSPAAQP